MATLIVDENDRLDKIQRTGYWRVTIRPAYLDKERPATLEQCVETIEVCAVRKRGWDYPHIDYDNIRFMDHRIQGGGDSMGHVEFWQYFQSGMFVHYFAMREDYMLDEKKLVENFATGLRSQEGRYLCINNLLFTLTKVYEFAARLASRGLLKPSAEVHVTLVGTRGRTPFLWEGGQFYGFDCFCTDDKIRRENVLFDFDLAARAGEIALTETFGFLDAFRFDPPEKLLAEKQRRFWRDSFFHDDAGNVVSTVVSW